jgi:hypothetical protein
LAEGFGECLEIRLLVFDKLNKLISDVTVAKFGAEPGSYQYESESHFITQDTFLTRHIRTYSTDEITLEKLTKTIGDTIWMRQIINKNGTINSETIDSNLTSKYYKNKNGFVTEKMIQKNNTKRNS